MCSTCDIDLDIELIRQRLPRPADVICGVQAESYGIIRVGHRQSTASRLAHDVDRDGSLRHPDDGTALDVRRVDLVLSRVDAEQLIAADGRCDVAGECKARQRREVRREIHARWRQYAYARLRERVQVLS